LTNICIFVITNHWPLLLF